MNYIQLLTTIFGKSSRGELRIYTPCDQELYFQGTSEGVSCDIKIRDWSTLDLIAKRGDIGLGEAYHWGLWESSDLSNFLTYCSQNLSNLTQSLNGNLFHRMMFFLYNRLIRLNTRYGSKKNILKHYDIGNDFYALWLDETMTYSSGLRKKSEDSLKESQTNKYYRIMDRLDVADKNILEIGCGWGGFAEHAALRGANVTGITISNKQYGFAKKRLAGKARILLQDYRTLSKKFHHIVSIEMFEAVGEKYWPTYFQALKRSLMVGGKAMIQTITINDDAFPQYRKNSDYIRHHVFPGGMLPSKSVFCHEAKKSGFHIGDIFEFGQDYAWTLAQWKKNFNAHYNQLLSMGYPTVLLRSWNFYLSMAMAGFKSRRTDVMQIELINGKT